MAHSVPLVANLAFVAFRPHARQSHIAMTNSAEELRLLQRNGSTESGSLLNDVDDDDDDVHDDDDDDGDDGDDDYDDDDGDDGDDGDDDDGADEDGYDDDVGDAGDDEDYDDDNSLLATKELLQWLPSNTSPY